MSSDNGQQDALWIARAQKGDRSGLDNLIRKYERRAYQYAYRLTRDQDLASDLVASAFVRVYSAIPNFKGNSAFTTWLYRILTNCYLDIKKTERSRPTVSLEQTLSTDSGTEVTRQFEDKGPSPSDVTEQSAREDRMQEAVASLPEYQQAMLIMFHVENLSYEEIAAALDLPLGTVKSRLNRARLSLREALVSDQELFQR
ncbi:MAG TPA: sigma-70 family RNA polymerase sigma factor [Fimbriimonadaceae bacterium]|nr:sigma-70 family RNA polymerase sigma factor [Fimbriimonadaceae bacterium]HRJ33430.1 sigma-70 family RNA polymerase sigma factor [Fimbriimonadaceae bacterium]